MEQYGIITYQPIRLIGHHNTRIGSIILGFIKLRVSDIIQHSAIDPPNFTRSTVTKFDSNYISTRFNVNYNCNFVTFFI